MKQSGRCGTDESPRGQHRHEQAAPQTRLLTDGGGRGERKFRKVFHHANDAMFIADPEADEFLDCNPAAAELIGVPREVLRTERRPSDVHPDDVMTELNEFFETVLTEGYGYTDEVTIQTETGAIRFVEMSAVYIELGDRPCVVNHVRDVTDRRARERRLERQNERLDEFVSVVSHDLQTPLSTLGAALELAEETGDLSYLDQCRSAVERMDQLLDDLLTLAEQGGEVESPTRLSLAVMADACWGHVETGDAELEIETDRAVRGAESRVAQLFENLFRNAVEHGGNTIRVGDTDGGFYVADDGPGIPESGRERVFDRGYSTADSGTGFGLAIVRRITRAHDWSVSVAESDAGGTRVEITGVEWAEE